MIAHPNPPEDDAEPTLQQVWNALGDLFPDITVETVRERLDELKEEMK